MSNIDKRAIRSKARPASTGVWIRESGDGWEAICSANDQANGNFIIAHFEGPDAQVNREFMQAANPDVVLALLDELEAKDKRIAEQAGTIANQEKWIRGIEEAMITATDRAKAAEKRIDEIEVREVTLPENITSANAPEVIEIAAEAERLGLRGTYASYAVGWNARGKADKETLREAGVKVAAAGKGE